MTNEEFDRLVNQIQARYGSRPLALRLRLAWLVAIGYSGFLAVLLGVLVLATALLIGAVVAEREPGIVLMALVALLLAFGLCQALVVLWVPMESQPGREVTAAEVPRLFHLLEGLQDDLQVAPFDHVRITPEFNAGVQMIPRWGVFGFNRNHLYLGLPLMRMLTPEQFASVLAHECAHCSSRHDRFGMWIYRLRQTWSRVFVELQDQRSSGFVQMFRGIILPFVNWYWPRFNAHAFVLSRANEYEADRQAAAWAGVEPTAAALFRIECVSQRLTDRFWHDITRLAKTEPAVPDNILERLTTFLAERPEPAEETRRLQQAGQRLTGNDDTHPSLADRLKSLGQTVERFAGAGFPTWPTDSAAATLLGPALPKILRDVNANWQKDNTLRWQNVFHQARRLEQQRESEAKWQPSRLATAADPSGDLTGETDTENFDVEQIWKQARAVCELQGTAAAEPLLRRLLARKPTHALANLTLGRHLLERDHVEGEQCLRRILEEEDSELIPAACEQLIAHFQHTGQAERLRETRSLLSRFEAAQVAATKERSSITAADTFVPHGLSDLERADLTTTLAAQSDLDAAWLVRKELQHFRKQRLFLLVAHSPPTGLFGVSHPDRDRTLVAQLIAQVKLPGRVVIVAPQGGFRTLARKIMSRPEASIFPVTRQK